MAGGVADISQFDPEEIDLSGTPITVYDEGPCRLRGIFVHTASAADVELKDGSTVKWTIPAGMTGPIPCYDIWFKTSLVIDGGTTGLWNIAVERLNP